jgi:hypothetical protein
VDIARLLANTFGVRFCDVPVVQRIERGFPKAKRTLLPESAPVTVNKQNAVSQLLATTSVSSAVITHAPIFAPRVTQMGDTQICLFGRIEYART